MPYQLWSSCTLVMWSFPPEPRVQMMRCLEKRKHCLSPSFFRDREPSRPLVIFPFSLIGTWIREPVGSWVHINTREKKTRNFLSTLHTVFDFELKLVSNLWKSLSQHKIHVISGVDRYKCSTVSLNFSLCVHIQIFLFAVCSYSKKYNRCVFVHQWSMILFTCLQRWRKVLNIWVRLHVMHHNRKGYRRDECGWC